MDKQQIRYEVIGRAVVDGLVETQRHYLKLLYRGDGTPWWACSAGLELPIPENFIARPGDFITLTISRDTGNG